MTLFMVYVAAERRRQLKLSFGSGAFQHQPLVCRPLQPSSNSTHEEQLNSSPSRMRTSCPPSRIRSFNQDGIADKSRERLRMCQSMQSTGKLQVSPEQIYDFTSDDLQDLGEIGRGAFGTVNKMVHRKSNTVMAVKRIRSTVDEKEQKQLLMDLEVVMKSNECPCIVQFYGALFKEGDCWICMELMDTSLDKFYKFIYEKLNQRIPENILGKITVAPERIDPQRARGYDVRSDVWSLGITLMEVATGHFPYPKWNSVFEQLYQVVQGDPPRLSPNENGNQFSTDFVNFVNTCLIKEETQRPKYNKLLEHNFIRSSDEANVDVAAYVSEVLDLMTNNGATAFTMNQP
ncbi:Dual specificity mitogen-activated protein kinase kinase 2 [Blattella germanica]|nr:Dual specificity mitogen-activated protein kinase kinase 2 [Blattella germanica]